LRGRGGCSLPGGIGSRERPGESAAAARRAEGELPQPFFPATTIPFTISQEVCARGHQPVVSLKIYNVLVQMVAIPVLANGSAERLDSLILRCGEYRAHWDGKYLDGRREATPGIYYYQLTVDGERYTRKMIAQQKVTSQQ
jgi:hypothetical protein